MLIADPAENAPLLSRAGEEAPNNGGDSGPILGVYDPSKPLTNLERLLAVVAIFMLALAGVFIGLFAETEKSLKKEREHHHHRHPIPTGTTTGSWPIPTGVPGKVG